MKKTLLSLITLASLALAQNSTVTNGDPFSQMDKMFEMQMKQMELMEKQMDQMFKAFDNKKLGSTPMVMSNSSILSSGLQDKGDHYEVVINVGKGDVKADVKAKDGLLSINIESKKEINNKNGKFGVIKSYASSRYMQSFTLPKDADENKIDYSIKDGKMVIKIEKSKNN